MARPKKQKKKEDISEAIRRFRQGPPSLPRPKPQPPKRPEPPDMKDYLDSPGFQGPEERKKSKYRP